MQPWWYSHPLVTVQSNSMMRGILILAHQRMVGFFFLAGNSTPTIPHMFSKHKDSGFLYGCADAAAADGRRGSNIYEVNLWLWSFGRGKPRLGGLSVEKTFERQVTAGKASKERAAENRRRHKADKA